MSGTYKTSSFTKLNDNIYITKTGRIEKCHKIAKGLPCSRHYPISNNIGARVYVQQRVLKKLTPFERNTMKLFALVSKTPFNQLKEEYSKIVARYAIDGVRIPDEEEIKGLQKILLELSEESPDVSTNKAKKWFKKMTLGESFTAAGFWATRDMFKRTLTRVKNFFTGGILASTLFLTACSPGAAGQGTQQEQILTVEEYEEEAGKPAVNEEYINLMFKEPQKWGEYTYEYSSGLEFTKIEGVYEYSNIEKEQDENGSYKRVEISLSEDYINAYPVEYMSDAMKAGYSETEIREALKFYSDFALNETVDSIAVDNPDRYLEWWDTVGSKAFDESTHQVMLDNFKPWNTSLGKPVLDFNNTSTHILPGIIHLGAVNDNATGKGWTSIPLVRDGESRTLGKHITQIRMHYVEDGTIFIDGVVNIVPVHQYDRYYQLATLIELQRDFEPYFNKEGHKYIPMGVSVGYSLKKDASGDWKIVGFAMDAMSPQKNFLPVNEMYQNGISIQPNIKFEDLRYVGVE